MKSFKLKLFIWYSLTLITLTLTVSIPLYYYFSKQIEQNAAASIEQLSSSAAGNLSAQLNTFNSVTFQLYNSYDYTRSTLADYLVLQKQYSSSSVNLQVQKSVENYMMIALAAYPNIEAMHIYMLNGDSYSKSKSTSIQMYKWDDADRFSYIKDYAGSAVLVAEEDRFSLVRKLQWGLFDIGYLRVDLKPNAIIDDEKLNSHYDEQVMIHHGSDLVYISDAAAREKYESAVSEAGESSSLQVSLNQYASSAGLYRVQAVTEDNKYMVSVLIGEDELGKPLRIFRAVMIGIVVFVLLVSVVFYYYLAHLLTKPIIALRQALNVVNLEDEQELQLDNKYKWNELESLRRSFQRMNTRLKNTMEEKIHFQTLQIQSHYQMLQAQINPHFMFNMLSVITILADKKDAEGAAAISRKLSNFMRYTIGAKSSVTALADEMDFTGNYLSLMQSRYMHRLIYKIVVDKPLERLKIAKMSIQPIVENCIQHGFGRHQQPLRISVQGQAGPNGWTISIRDNGDGFADETLIEIEKKIARYLIQIEQAHTAKEELTLGGMGLTSTLARLKLLWKHHFSYQIGNHPDGGAIIILHGDNELLEAET